MASLKPINNSQHLIDLVNLVIVLYLAHLLDVIRDIPVI